MQPEPNLWTQGRYHYHGYPWKLIDYVVKKIPGKPTYLLGYAADGYPIYTPWNHDTAYDSGYILRPGPRGNLTGTGKHPDGHYDGTFVQDYHYNPHAKLQMVKNEVMAKGNYAWIVTPHQIQHNKLVILDARNGPWAKTPEYPNGIFMYVLTTDWPFIPRYFANWPSTSFKQLIPPERSQLYNCGELHKYKGHVY